MVLEHFRIVVCAVTPKLPMHETIASIPRKAEVVPIPVCPSTMSTWAMFSNGLCGTITGSHRDCSLALLGVADVLAVGRTPL